MHTRIRYAPILTMAATFAGALWITAPAPAAAGPSQGLSIAATADDAIVAGELAGITIIIWNAGPDPVPDVHLHNDLPLGVPWRVAFEGRDNVDDCTFASSGTQAGQTGLSFGCDLGQLPASDKAGGIVLHVTGETDADACGVLQNLSWAEAPGLDRVQAEASIAVECPTPSQGAEPPGREAVMGGAPQSALPDTALARPTADVAPALLVVMGLAALVGTGAAARNEAHARR